MKIWPINADIPDLGICEVRETTDRETSIANKRGLNYAPRSNGFVNLFRDGKFVGWCGVNFAFKRAFKSKEIKLPKYLREIGELIEKYG
jgi:hypothetical protein